jgi:hypothetical protein
MVTDLPTAGVVSILVADVHEVEAAVELVDEEGNPAHAEIMGLTKARAVKLAIRCAVVLPPTEPTPT